MENQNFDIPISAMALNRNSNFKNEKNETLFDEKNYLNTKLAKGEHSKQLRIRLLPMDLTTGNPFFKTHQHNVKVPVEVSKSGYKSYFCLQKGNLDHDVYGSKCPFCEINYQAYNNSRLEQDPIKKKNFQKLSIANRAREAVICRCIDRDHPEEGVKFWKFNISLKEDDPYNQIMNLWESRMKEGEAAGRVINILSLTEGYDLIITITEGSENTIGNTIAITDAKFPSPLSNNPEEAKAWIYDSKKWDEVFKVKDYDYLSVISIGEVPYKFEGKWIAKSEFEASRRGVADTATRIVEDADAFYRNPQPPTDFTSEYEVPDDNFESNFPF